MNGLMKKKKSAGLVTRLIIAGICCILLLIATFAVPRHKDTVDINDRGLKGGPDSYFRHIYDPQHLMGPLGEIDLELDNFQRISGNAVLFAAFPSLPSKDPYFTMQIAESWAPGRKADDRGVIVFLFMKEKMIRVEVGYGYEDVLTDLATKHLIENTMLGPLRAGETTEAVKAAARVFQETLAAKGVTRRETTTFRSELPGLRDELKRRAALVARIWLIGKPLLRIVIGGIALWVVVSVLWMIVSLAGACRKLLNFFNTASGRNFSGAREALGGIYGNLLGIGQVALMVFILGTIGEYFKSGSGMFGGGGVTLFW